MALHAAFHWILESDVPLPELVPAEGAPAADLRFTVGPPAPQAAEGPWTVLSRAGDGKPWIEWKREGEERTLRFPGLADFRVGGDGRTVACLPREGVPPETLRHLFLDTVLPCVLNHRGHLVLHGSAVEIGERAVAFVGDSGAGKSTLAAAFAARGHRCVGDDALLLLEAGEEVLVVPAYPGLRLWPGSPALERVGGSRGIPVTHYSDKVRVDLPGAGIPYAAGPLPLLRLHLLTGEEPREGGIRIEPLTRRDALVALLARSYFLDPGDPERMGGEFLRWVRSPVLARTRSLRYPRDGALLDGVLDAVLAEAGA